MYTEIRKEMYIRYFEKIINIEQVATGLVTGKHG